MKTFFNSSLKYALGIPFLLLLIIMSSCNDDEETITSFVDARDGQTYEIVAIGNQIWMAENLNYAPVTGMSWCYEENSNNCTTYGRLYDWHTALTVAPDGWHLPSDAEWEELFLFLGGDENVGGKMKETGYDHWDAPNAGADNSSGFTALGAGSRFSGGPYHFIRESTSFWSSTEKDGATAWGNLLDATNAMLIRAYAPKEAGHSVRCIKD